jgi:predicted nucleic acid-binding protein
MNDRVFVDTNILVYSRDASESRKQKRALDLLAELWRDRTGRVSIQVLNEYYVTVTRKLVPGMSPDDAWADVEALSAWDPIVLDVALLGRARAVQQRYGTSWWDATIIAAAYRAQCGVILSEDLAHGQAYFGVVVRNPFTA